MNSVLKILISVLCIGTAYAESEKEEVMNDLLKGYSSSLCDAEYIGCLGLELEFCLKYIEQSADACPFDPFYEAVINRSPKKAKNSGRAFGMCVSKGVFSKAEITEETITKCQSSLPRPRVSN